MALFLLNDIAKIAVRVCSLFGTKLDMLTALRVNDNDARLARSYGGLTVEVDTSQCQSFMIIHKYLGLRDIYMFEPTFPIYTPDRFVFGFKLQKFHFNALKYRY